MKLHKAIRLLALLAVQTAGASTITVTTTADSGPGSLRDALASAADGDTIDFSVTGTIMLASTLPRLTNHLSIVGPGPRDLTVDGNYRPVFYSSSNSVVSISSLTVAKGNIVNDHGTMTVSNCTVTGNSNFFGGGIANSGSGGGSAKLFVIASTISSNLARSAGGGIFNNGSRGNAIVQLINCTLSGNTAFGNGGGGIYTEAAGGTSSVLIVNSTLNGNVGDYYGDNISIYGYQGSATVEIGSTILAHRPSYYNIYNYFLVGTVSSLGHNLSSDKGVGNDYGSGGLTAPGDQINTDPMLGPLQDNGGPTFTHAPLPCSSAIDRGTNLSALATDQRGSGFARTLDDTGVPNATGGDGTDIGAFEVQTAATNPSVPVAKCKSVTLSAGTNCMANASIDDGSFDPDPGDTITLLQTPPGPYPLGSTTVTLTVTDCHGASSQCMATVNVVDDTPPTFIGYGGFGPCGNVFGTFATSPAGAEVNFEVPVSDNCSASATCMPPSGSTFAIGTTIVNCQATDGVGLMSSCAFTIYVKGAAEQINDLIATVQALSIDNGVKNGLLVKLQDALNGVNTGKKSKACGTLQDFINLCNAQLAKRNLDADTANYLIGEASRIRAVIGC